jgi:hypothetical protein
MRTGFESHLPHNFTTAPPPRWQFHLKEICIVVMMDNNRGFGGFHQLLS